MSQAMDVHTLAGAYALDALTEIERAAFTRHLAGCESCAVEVAGLTEAASRLAVLDAQSPPPRLKTAVLDEIYRTRQVPAARPGSARGPVSAPMRWLAAAAAAVVGLAGIGTVWVVQENRLADLRAGTTQELAERARIAEILAARDAQIVATTATGGGRVTVVVAPSLGDGVIALADMRAPGPDEAYQLWLIDDGVPVSAGILAAGANSGTALLHDIGGADTVGVTLEPASGSRQPTPPILADIELS
jgi:hypothetical protein